MNNKCLYLVILCLVAILGYYIFFGFGDEIDPIDLTKYKAIETELKEQQLKYQDNIEILRMDQVTLEKQIDSLEQIKVENKIVYIEKIQVIDSINSIELANDFKGLFSKYNIK